MLQCDNQIKKSNDVIYSYRAYNSERNYCLVHTKIKFLDGGCLNAFEKSKTIFHIAFTDQNL